MNISRPPKFTLAAIGPGLVLIAMGLGSGEFILWPYLVAQFGFGVVWGAVVGITLQYFLSNESGRYTLATGGSVYSGMYNLAKWIPYWFIISTFASFAWPGIIGSGGKILGDLVGVEDHKWLTIGMLIIIGLLLTFGGKVYDNLERVQKIFLMIALPTLLLITILLINPDNLNHLANGIFGIGEGYLFLPEGISIITFLGSVAYAGAAGNLVLSHSFYVQDKALGMASNINSQVDIENKSNNVPKSEIFEQNLENISNFKNWFSYVAKEQFISFWVLGLVTILCLVYISYSLVYPYIGVEGLDFIKLQGQSIALMFNPILGVAFLSLGSVFLFTTQLGIFETTSRIMTENIQLASKNIRESYSRSTLFYFFLWLQIITAITITLAGLEQPIQLLILSTFFSAVSMFVLSALVLWLNSSKNLPKEIQPGLFRKLMMLISFLFFGAFSVITVADVLN